MAGESIDLNVVRRPALILEESSTTELLAMRQSIGLVIIPVGSVEQHGPNLMLGVDTALAEAASRIVAEALYPTVLVAPAIRWGMSHHHMDFVGTITLNPDTFVMLLLDIVNSLCHHGFERFLFLNGHSGNRSVLETTVLRAYQETGALFVGSCQCSELGEHTGVGHAAQIEVSYAMYLAPEAVKLDALTDAKLEGIVPLDPRVYVPWPTRRTSRNGPSGPVQGASRELGKTRLKSSLEGLIEVARKIVDEELMVENAPVSSHAVPCGHRGDEDGRPSPTSE